MERKTIIFMDLEGTVLNAENFKLEEEKVEGFLKQLSLLEKKNNSKISINLVSPIKSEKMIEVKKKINECIEKYNKQYNKKINEIEIAACSITDESTVFKDNRIVQLPKKGLNEYTNSKYQFVSYWYGILEERYDICDCIYIGDGDNDYNAMQYVKGLKVGKVICPGNAQEKVKKIANYVGTGNDIIGVTEALREFVKGIRTLFDEVEKER